MQNKGNVQYVVDCLEQPTLRTSHISEASILSCLSFTLSLSRILAGRSLLGDECREDLSPYIGGESLERSICFHHAIRKTRYLKLID